MFLFHVGNQEALGAGIDKFSRNRLELDGFKYLSLMSVNLQFSAICAIAKMIVS